MKKKTEIKARIDTRKCEMHTDCMIKRSKAKKVETKVLFGD
jgi:phage terminase small subunit